MLLDHNLSQVLLIDIQERLLPAMHQPLAVVHGCITLIQAAQHFKVPVTLTEHYPKGIGRTDTRLLAAHNDKGRIFEKLSFSACREPDLREYIHSLRAEGRSQVILAGIESHVCVLQTALDLVAQGMAVFCVEDAMSSRLLSSKATALMRLRAAGCTIVTMEMVLFEWVQRAGSPDFKAMLPLIKTLSPQPPEDGPFQ